GVHKYKDGVTRKLHAGLQGLIKSKGITYITGQGVLASPTSVQVGDQLLTGRHILLATGSVPKSLPGLTIDGDRVISSDHALVLDRVPSSVVVLGGGGERGRVRQRLAFVRCRGHRGGGPAASAAAGGRGLLQAAGAGVPPPRH